MKKLFFFFITSIFGLTSYSQITFEKGYFINNAEQKIDCLIKNIDWKNNPDEFEYKLPDNDVIKKVTIKNVKEFGITGLSKYVRAETKIDVSKKATNNLSKIRNPIFEEKLVFLKVLVEGKATLFFYQKSNLKRFFYKKENSEIEPLVFKYYLTSDNRRGVNNRFKQQLINHLNCNPEKTLGNLQYKKSELVRFFINYNECINSTFISFEKGQKKDLFNLSIKTGINNSSLSIENSSLTNNINFDRKLNFRFGLELEFIAPFNKNKWSFIIEPTYQYFNSEKTTNNSNISGGQLIADVNYKSFELPIGVRHYSFLTDDSQIFVNAFYIFDITLDSTMDFFRSDGSNINSLEIATGNNFAIGIGYKYKDRYSLEIRTQTNRALLGNHTSWTSDYKTLSLILGYALF